jgi:meso-butanediol dehydrogenase / (S,S)-butanediol dehydrogenase / diacetyl reductase
MSGRLAGKVAFITGTGSGIGRAAALLFAREGALIAGCGTDIERSEETARLVREAGGTMYSKAPVDLGDPDQASAWVDEALKEYGQVDILYNNAGFNTVGPFGQATDDDWRTTMRSDLETAYNVTHAVWPHMLTRGGSIINTASILATRATGVPMAAHGVAKAAVAGFAPHLAVEGGPHGIRVNTVSPGLTRSAQTEPLLNLPEDSATRQQVRTSPLGRIGEPEDVANVALFLASDESAYVTGTNIVVDGGQTLAMGVFF